jgi:uncharacterized protein (TIGR02246 family)
MPTLRWGMLVAAWTSMLLSPQTISAADGRPETLVEDFVRAWNSHDMEAFARLYTSDATWVVTYDNRLDGRDAIVADMRVAHERWAKTSSIVASKTTAKLLGADVAVVQFNVLMTAGNAEPVGRTLLLAAINQDGGWKISAGQLTKPNCLP